MKKLITSANVFNGTDEKLIEDVSVLIEDNLITQIGNVDLSIVYDTFVR